MFKKIINLFILLGGLIGVFIWSYHSFKDLSVSVILFMSSFTVLIRILNWPFNEWLSIISLNTLYNSYKQNNVELNGVAASNSDKFNTTIESLSKSKEIETFFKWKVMEKETIDFVIDLNNNLLGSLLISLLTAAAAIVIGNININTSHNIDPSKLMYSFIPITWQLSSLIIPFLHLKKRNEKLLVQ